MESSVAVLGRLHALLDLLGAGELALLDGEINADHILPDNTAGADVQVSDLRVAHQALRKADGDRGGLELGVPGGALGELVHDRGLCVGDGIAVLGRVDTRDAPAINDDCR